MLNFSVFQYRKQLTEMLSSLIAIPSLRGTPEPNMPYGRDIFKALMFMLDRAERLDLESINLFGHTGYAKYGSGKETVAVLAHLDVVPPGEGWSSDPFKAEIRDGRIYGRGAVDDKAGAVAALFALHALKENCIPLKKEVRVIFGCSEETEWSDMDFYKEKCGEPDYVISPDACFPIINREKGVLHIKLSCEAPETAEPLSVVTIDAGTQPNIVPNEARCVLRAPAELIERAVEVHCEGMPAKFKTERCGEGIIITALGESAHGAHPERGVNALSYLLCLLGNLPLASNQTSRMIYALAEKIGLRYDGALTGIAAHDEDFGSLTQNLGSLHIADGRIEAQIDIRYPGCITRETLLKKLNEAFGSYGLSIGIEMDRVPHHVPEDSELVSKLKVAYEEVFHEPAECLCSSGATYARAFKNGVAFGPVPKDRPSVEHCPDEYIEIEDLYRLTEAIANAIIQLCDAQDDVFTD